MTKIVNIDALKTPETLVVIIDGVEHQMKEATLRDTIDLFNAIQKLTENPSLVAEVDLMVNQILRYFPTMSREMIDNMPMTRIERLFAIVRNGGEQAAEQGDDAGKEKPAS